MEVDEAPFSLVFGALEQTQLSGLSNLLKMIARLVEAHGCILWELAPGANLANSPGSLFVLAQWFLDDHVCSVHDLPLQSATGEAIRTRKPRNVQDVATDPGVHHTGDFFQQTGVRAFLSVPIEFPGGVQGAVNLYRQQAFFTEEEISRIVKLARLVPALYETISDKATRGLLEEINRILQGPDPQSTGAPAPLDTQALDAQAIGVAGEICRTVARTFGTLEVSLFLADRLEAPHVHSLAATTWERPGMRRRYDKVDETSLTSWVLSRGQRLRVFDLAHFNRDRERMSPEYQAIRWESSDAVAAGVREYLGLPSDELPPLTFMAVPIKSGSQVLGAIRCFTAKEGPSYFSDREWRTLELVASQIERWWTDRLRRREIEEENRTWRELVKILTMLNAHVYEALKSEGQLGAPSFFKKALELTRQVIDGAEIMDVRLYDEEAKELFFSEKLGDAWSKGSKDENTARAKRRFPVDGKSAGAHVYRTKKTYVIQDVTTDPHYSETFPGVTRVIVAPFALNDAFFGVIDIRSTGDRPFARHAGDVAELLGQQLGLYYHQALIVGEMHKAKRDLTSQVDIQDRALRNWKHQLQSPILTLRNRVVRALTELTPNAELEKRFLVLRGLCKKTLGVATSVGFFVDLSKGITPRVNTDALNPDPLLKMLIEAAQDQELISAGRNHFHVDRSGFNIARLHEFMVDHLLLGQAISALLDNASKYSEKNSQVRIHGGVTGSDRFHISVASRSERLVIRHDEVKRCVERGWRGAEAEAVTGEGEGLGLWIVDNIMRAHGGDLVVVPTTSDAITEMKLVFPRHKGRPKGDDHALHGAR